MARVGRQCSRGHRSEQAFITRIQTRLTLDDASADADMITRRTFISVIGVIVAALFRLDDVPAEAQGPPASAIAPTGRLRAAMNLGNSILVVKDTMTGELQLG
jgi:hypothetical protein